MKVRTHKNGNFPSYMPSTCYWVWVLNCSIWILSIVCLSVLFQHESP